MVAFATMSGATAIAHVPRGFYGLNSWTSGMSPGEYQTMGRNRVGVLRFQFNWQVAEPSPGTFDWTRSDDYIGKSLQNGMKPLPFLFATPKWLSKKYSRPPIHSRRARRSWKEFVTAAVDRYGTDGTFFKDNPSVPYHPVRVWQIWNEENLYHAWAPRPDPDEYAKLLRISANAIYGADPNAQVMLGGMFYGRTHKAIASWKFLNTLYQHRGKRFFDIAAVHPFSPGLRWMRYQIKKMRQAMVSNHDAGSPLWVTELGWGSARSPSPLTRGPQGQARMLKRSFRYIGRHRHALGVKRLLWFSWRDGATSASGQCEFCGSNGLFTEDLQPKPAWDAFRHLTRTAGR